MAESKFFNPATQKWENMNDIPTMSKETKGGAKLGSGLKMESDTLSVDTEPLEVQMDGFAVSEEYAQKAKDFAALFAATEECESFLFFTDPHFQGNPENNIGKMLAAIRAMYRKTPTSFCVCGGDWLNSRADTPQACYFLGCYDAYMRKFLPQYVPIFGNHDSNYQNAAYIATAPNYDHAVGIANMLPQKTVDNLFFREEGKAYYKYAACQSTVYVLDTGIDWEMAMNPYRWGQIDWLAKALKQDDAKHSFVACHIGYHDMTVPPMTTNYTKVIAAYNGRTTVSLNGQSYDFAGCKGTCHFVLAGHNHADYNGTVEGIPVILTTQVKDITHPERKWPTFDLCLADYDKAVLHLVRVGNGADRHIPIIATIA